MAGNGKRGGDSEILYGLHAVRARLTRDASSCERLVLQEGLESKRVAEIRRLAEHAGVKVERAPERELEQMAAGRHQGVALVVQRGRVGGEAALRDIVLARGASTLLLVLDGVTDPHNLGACLRSAAAMGVDAVVAPKDRAVGLTPVVAKVASGGAEIVPLIQVTNLARTLGALQQEGVWVIGLSANAEEPIEGADLTGPIAMVLGSEGRGLRKLTERECDLLVRIPHGAAPGQPGGELVDSLNVSVAAGVALYEAVRQRRAASG